VVRCGSKNEHQKDMCVREISLNGKYLLNIAVLLSRGLAPALYTLKNHSSKR
jgi:hypothetical protein